MTRAQRSLAVLTVLTIFATGLLSQALSSRSGVLADVQAAGALLLLLISATLLVRTLRALIGPPRTPGRVRGVHATHLLHENVDVNARLQGQTDDEVSGG